MQIIGRVASILNNVHVILELNEPVPPEAEVQVFGKATMPETAEAAGVALKEVVFPKGTLRILTEQSEKKYYLAERFRSEVERRVIKKPLAGLYAGLLGEQEVVETVYGEWSAKLDAEKSLKVNLDMVIAVGDLVGR